MGEKRVLHMDFESFSDVDIGKCGMYRYMESPVFEILLLSYALDDGPVRVVDFTAGETLPAEFQEALNDDNVLISAWNSAFERNAMRTAWGSLCPPIERFDDPMLLAARCGLPLSLKDAGAAIGLREDEAKLRDGRALIRFFCQPCTPTTANGGRRRNLPKDSSGKWERFKEYNAQDVVAERAIRNKLRQWLPQPQEELQFWWLDQKINDEGIRVDLDLARQAVAMSNRRKEELTQEAKALTGLENPNSVAQAKRWLEEQEGKAFPSLNKKEIEGIEEELTSSKSKQFLALRSEAAKSSVSKYEAMLRAATRDEHVKGCFQFYGAGRTGRAAGRLVQLQNLPQNHLDTLDQCRRMVKNGDYENIAACYGSVTRPLSELIRTALLPEPGCKFLVADFSAIEARVIAWIAGEQWVLDAFAAGKDIYCETASQMFKVPVVKHGVNGELRAKGKVAVLACVAEGELVLTNKGLIPIEQVTTNHLLWDGIEWVRHKGVIYQGEREVIEYERLRATPDHKVYIEGQPEPVELGVAAACGAHLLKSGAGRKAIRTRADHQPGAEIHPRVGNRLRANPLRKLWSCILDLLIKPHTRAIERLSELQSASKDVPEMAIQTRIRTKATLHEPKQQTLEQLRGAWDHLRLLLSGDGLRVDRREPRSTATRTALGDRPNRQRQGLRPGEHTLGDTGAELRESAQHQNRGMASGRLAVCTKCGSAKTGAGYDPRRDIGRRVESGRRETQELAKHKELVRVYDIRDAGPRHRFTVSGVLVHNCNYGGGVNALRAFGADKMGMTETEMQNTVDLYRKANPRTVALWNDLERAATSAVEHKGNAKAKCGIRFTFERGILWMTLPSGRRIAYLRARMEDDPHIPGKLALTYQDAKGSGGRLSTWGGKIVENCVQATARDLLRDAMLRLDAAGYDIRAHVHDEVIISEPIGGRSVEDAAAIMGAPCAWAPGLPLRADGYETPYYRKD